MFQVNLRKNVSGDLVHKAREKYILLPTLSKMFLEQRDRGNVVSPQHAAVGCHNTTPAVPLVPPMLSALPPREATKYHTVCPQPCAYR